MDADLLHDRIRSVQDEMLSLLRRDGRVPYKGTEARERWDRLEEKRSRLFEQWVALDSGKKMDNECPECEGSGDGSFGTTCGESDGDGFVSWSQVETTNA